MVRFGRPCKKTTIWLGGGDGYTITREDAMVSIEYPGLTGEDDLQIFILPSLFPEIRAAMRAAEGRPAKRTRAKEPKRHEP